MGWFAIAAVIGFLLYWNRARAVSRSLCLAAFAILILAVPFLHVYQWRSVVDQFRWPAFFDHLEREAGTLGEGPLARILFGAMLGVLLAYACEPANAGTPRYQGAWRRIYLLTGLALILLGAAAPHVDRWLSHLNGLKTEVIEIQLANVSSVQKSIIPDARESFVYESLLRYLREYDGDIQRDIDFINLFVLPDLNWQKDHSPSEASKLQQQIDSYAAQAGQLHKLHPAFRDVISPLARCMELAIKGGLSIEAARGLARPLADLVQQIVILEQQIAALEPQIAMLEQRASKPQASAATNSDLLEARGKLTAARKNLADARRKLMDGIRDLPNSASSYKNAPGDCPDGSQSSSASQIDIPPHTQYTEFPYLFGAMASLLFFVGDDDSALKILEMNRRGVTFHDYKMPYLEMKIMYFHGEPAMRYKPLLDDMRQTARLKAETVDRVINRCPQRQSCDPGLSEKAAAIKEHARHAELVALNNTAYGIAQDLAGQDKTAESLLPVAEECADELAGAERRGELKQAERDQVRDTIAFVSLLVQARKDNPDRAELEKDIAVFEDVIANQEDAARSQPLSSKTDRALIVASRAHLTSAMQLQK